MITSLIGSYIVLFSIDDEYVAYEISYKMVIFLVLAIVPISDNIIVLTVVSVFPVFTLVSTILP